jgi:cytochrome b6-f complex iron-sulfur subunit
MTHLSRREFLKLVRAGSLVASSGLAVAGLLRFLGYKSSPDPQTAFDLGPAAQYPLDSRTILQEPPAVLIHTASGFSALSLVCTHLGCTVEADSRGFACPCHGSRFDMNGDVVQGPAKTSLRSLRVQATEQGTCKLFTD